MSTFTKRALTALLVAGLSFAALANEPKRQPPDVGSIMSNQEQIRSELAARKGVFKDMSEKTRSELERKSTRLTGLLTGKEWAQLNDEDQIEVFNSLEWIKATMEDAEDNRLVCTQTKRPGSNMVYKKCRTVAQLREAREDTQRTLSELGDCKGSANCGVSSGP